MYKQVRKYLFIAVGILYSFQLNAQINTDRVILIGRNALYYEDYILSIQYFNQAIKAKPYLAEPYFFRALAKFYLDDSKGAEEDCTLTLDRNPFMVKAYQLRGDARQAQKNYEGASQDYQKALEVYPNEKFLLINLGIVKTQEKDYEQAELIYDKLVELHPKFPPAYLTRAVMYQERGDTIKAFEDYNAAIVEDKYMAQAYSMRGILHYSKKDYDNAMDDINMAISLEPKIVGNYINRGLIKYTLNDLRGAMTDYDKVMEIEPNNTIARFNRGLLRRHVGDYNRAIEDFDIVIRYEPKNYIAYLNRGFLKKDIGDFENALEDMDIVLEQYPEFYQGFYARSEIKRQRNDLKGAQADYNHARQEELRLRSLVASGELKDKDDIKTREQSDSDIDKFDMLVIADKTENETSRYENKHRGKIQDREVKLNPRPQFIVSYYEKDEEISHTVHFAKAVSNLNNKQILPHSLRITNSAVALNELQITRHFRSIDELSMQMEKNPQDEMLYYARGMEYMLVQDISSAIVDLEKAVELNSNFTLAHFSLAILLTKQIALINNDYEHMLGTSEENILNKQKPQSKLTISTGLIDPSKLEYEKINRAYNKILELDPSFIYAYYNRAELYYSTGDYRTAILNYNEAIELNPDFAEAYYNRALCRFHIGDEGSALSDMRKAGELGIMEAYSIIKRMTE